MLELQERQPAGRDADVDETRGWEIFRGSCYLLDSLNFRGAPGFNYFFLPIFWVLN